MDFYYIFMNLFWTPRFLLTTKFWTVIVKGSYMGILPTNCYTQKPTYSLFYSTNASKPIKGVENNDHPTPTNASKH